MKIRDESQTNKVPWWLYMIECRNGGIYTGVTVDVEARYAEHLAGKGAKYTRSNPPVKLLITKEYPDRRSALQAEYAMKRLTHQKKRAICLEIAF